MILSPEDYIPPPKTSSPSPEPEEPEPEVPVPVKRPRRKGQEIEIKAPEEPEEPVDVKNAKVIAEHILQHLNLSLDSVDQVLYGSDDHNDPGELVDLTGLWTKNYFLIRDGEDSGEEGNKA